MAALNIDDSDIPSLAGKVTIITGGYSGIGFATAKFLAEKNAAVHILDINQPTENIPNVRFHHCDITKWEDLRDAFQDIGHVDYVFANAGIVEETNYFADLTDSNGSLIEPEYRVLDVNLRAVYNTVKLAWSQMRKQKDTPGSIVITTSSSAYIPEQSLPVYSSGKGALVGLIRALRAIIVRDGITINGVAPGATFSNMLPASLTTPAMKQRLSINEAHFVGRALVYSAIATQRRRVQLYGKDKESDMWKNERWNGRVIVCIGDKYTEVEEGIADLLPFWFGRDNERMTREQQIMTDFREPE